MGAGEESGENDEPHFDMVMTPVPATIDVAPLYMQYFVSVHGSNSYQKLISLTELSIAAVFACCYIRLRHLRIEIYTRVKGCIK